MPLIPWEEKFTLGIKEVDEQHQKMLEIINRLFNIFDRGKANDPAEIDVIIKEMDDYAVYHFQTEERYFDLFDYPGAKEHIEIHDQYRDRVKKWRERYNASKDELVFFEISNFLQDWWIWHINNTDREYVPYFKAHGLA